LRALSRQVVAQLELRRHLALATDLAEQHRDLSERDPLTGLYNRRFFNDELSRRLSQGGSGALLVIDLDDFKSINDTLGHDAGDEVLGKVATAISSALRAEDFVARLGGDEFAVVLGRVENADALPVADKLRQAIRAIDGPGGERRTLDASIGGALFTRGGDLDELMREADRNMYAKKRGAAWSVRRDARASELLSRTV
jgi:diguanylate cyclase (GGDEF)-like protein